MSFDNQNLNKPLPAHEVVAEKKRRKLEAEINLLEVLGENSSSKVRLSEVRAREVMRGKVKVREIKFAEINEASAEGRTYIDTFIEGMGGSV